ncbi:MAG: hypothetical protein J6P95_07530 [Paludibacteraceae bacterium]|nr:hypothetical protein [Paludibacteraceae bacterium]
MINKTIALHTHDDITLQKAMLKKQLAMQKQALSNQLVEIKKTCLASDSFQYFLLGIQISNLIVSLHRKRT